VRNYHSTLNKFTYFSNIGHTKHVLGSQVIFVEIQCKQTAIFKIFSYTFVIAFCGNLLKNVRMTKMLYVS